MPKGGGIPDAFDMVPAQMMVCYYRYKRVSDKLMIANARAAGAGTATAKGWRDYCDSMAPITQEIDAEPKVHRKSRGNRRKVGPVSLEELENE